ncbi:hypothetical protein IW261DRAFT_1566576 [Armillaria novae-zelandiae]|uniref:Uncharacterized protein n=1 Tax=Armillaria novae-zelandiae TaxID=153914 RepID=A0AA39UCD0_9AGAR|nr:hypothetical protein IW261DRAFT_1566576 [Armillaria novae-zelandiae]
MSHSLTTLTICDCDVEYPDFRNGHLLLAGLKALKHVRLVAPVSTICRVLWSIVTWTLPAKESMSATLDITVCMDRRNRRGLCRELSRSFLYRVLLSTRYTDYRQFGGSVRITIASTLPRSELGKEVKYITGLCRSIRNDDAIKATFLTPGLVIYPAFVCNLVILVKFK